MGLRGFLLSKGVYTTFDAPGLLSKGVYTTFDVPGALITAALDINNRGQIVGFTAPDLTQTAIHGFLLHEGANPDPAGIALSTAKDLDRALALERDRAERLAAAAAIKAAPGGLAQTRSSGQAARPTSPDRSAAGCANPL
jgi:hypothetical protein